MEKYLTEGNYIPNLSEWCGFCQNSLVSFEDKPCKQCKSSYPKNPIIITIPKFWQLHQKYV